MFVNNVGVLEQLLGFPTIFTKCNRLRLTKPNGEILEIEAVPGKYVSCAFMDYLSRGQESFVVDGELYEMTRDFFGPIWDEEGHPTVDFLREPGVMVMIERGGGEGGY